MYMYTCNLWSNLNVRPDSLKRHLKLNMSSKSLKSYNKKRQQNNTFFNIIYCERVKNDLFGKAYFVNKKVVATLYDQGLSRKNQVAL